MFETLINDYSVSPAGKWVTKYSGDELSRVCIYK